MTYNNFSISSSKGKLYLKEKNPTEGYEEVLYGTDGKSKTYHKYFTSIKGNPKALEQKEVQFDGRTLRFLELTLVDGDVQNKISVPLKNKGGYTDEVKLLISGLNALEMGEEITLTTDIGSYKNKRGEDKSQLKIYINYVNKLNESGKGLSTGYIEYKDIPAPVSKVVAGDTTWDWSEQTEFYYAKLTEIIAKFGNTAPAVAAPASAPKAAPTPKGEIPKATPAEAFAPYEEIDDVDDLPF